MQDTHFSTRWSHSSTDTKNSLIKKPEFLMSKLHGKQVLGDKPTLPPPDTNKNVRVKFI